jgi:diaminopimelate decarboxylase
MPVCAARYNARVLPITVLVSGNPTEIVTEHKQLNDIAGRFRVPLRLFAGSFASITVAAE